MPKPPDHPLPADTEAYERMQAAMSGTPYVPPKRSYSQRTDERFKALRKKQRSLSFKAGEAAIGDWHAHAARLPDTGEAAQRHALDGIRFQHNAAGCQFALPDIDTMTPQSLADQMHLILHETPGMGGIRVQPHIGSSWHLSELLTGELSPASRKKKPQARTEHQVALKASQPGQNTVVPLYGPSYASQLHDHGFSIDLTLADPALAAHLPKLCGLLTEIEELGCSATGRDHEFNWERFTPEAVSRHLDTLCDRFDAADTATPPGRQAARGIIRELFATASYGYLAQVRDAVLYGVSDLPSLMRTLEHYQPNPRLRLYQSPNHFGVYYKDWSISRGGPRDGNYKMLTGTEPPQMRVHFNTQASLDLFATSLINLTKPGWREGKLPPSARQKAASFTLAVDNGELLAEEMRTVPKPAVRIRETPSQPAYLVDEQGVIRPDFGRSS